MTKGPVHRRERYRGSATDCSTRLYTIGCAVEVLDPADAAEATAGEEKVVVVEVSHKDWYLQ